jgi:hypothetical protein
MYQDPVKKAEREIEELIMLQQAEDNPEGGAAEAGGDRAPAPAARTPDAAREPAATRPSREDPNSDTYKARWETLQGKYAAETRRAYEQIRQLQHEVVSLREQAEMKSEAKPANVQDAIDELEREYGEEFTRVLDKRIDSKVDRKIEERLKPVREKVDRVSSENQLNAANAYFVQLSRLCPNWERQNTDQGFLDWLATTRVGRQSMQVLLNDAHQAGDAAGVADIFNAYGEQQKGNQTQTRRSARPNPNALIAPFGRGSGDHARIENAQGATITMTEVDKFYRDLELGKIKPEDAARRETEIMQAMKENRIVG